MAREPQSLMNPGARIRQLQKREAMLGKRPEGPPRQGPKKGPKQKRPKARRRVGGR